MAQMLINIVFWILNFVAGIVLNPILSIVSTLIPSFGSFVSSILGFVNYGLTYVAFFIKLLMIPPVPIILAVTLGVTILTFNMSVRAAGLVMAVYNYFKP